MKYNVFFTIACISVFCTASMLMSCADKPEMYLSSNFEVFDSYPLDTIEIQVNANVAWEVMVVFENDYDRWLTVGPDNGRRNGTIVIYAAENPTFEERRAQIIVTGSGVGIETINITQAPDFNIFENSSNFDPDFLRYCLENFDVDGDGILSAREARMVSEIKVDGRLLTSLNGIEHFTRLVTLYASENRIESIDLSKNTNLRQLTIRGNRLTRLDLTNNTELRVVECSWNNLSELNLNGLTNLILLEAFYGNLQQLNLSTNTSLDVLLLNGQDLTSIDLRNNINLTELWISENELSSLDLSNNTELVTLYCLYNNLTTLDLSKNTKLTNLYCGGNQFSGGTINVTNNTALITLSCVGSRLTTLDLTNNVNLNDLDITNNRFASINLTRNTRLLKIKASGNRFTNDIDLRTLSTITVGGREEIEFDFTRAQEDRSPLVIRVPNGLILRACDNPYINKDSDTQWCEGDRCVSDPCV